VRRPVSLSRVAVETFITAVTVIALVWLASEAHRLLKHRW
jgi:hypothetical protein